MKEAWLGALDRFLADHESIIARDLKLNLRRLAGDSSLSEIEAALIVLATARTSGQVELEKITRNSLAEAGVSSDEIREAVESAAIMAMLNSYYKFRLFVDDQQTDAEGYGATKLRMQSLANPVLGKERFEILALAVSILNGCEKCVRAHEKALESLQVSREKRHDVARLTAVVAGLAKLA